MAMEPQFNTGLSSMTQGLGSLSSALFPDPSKIAQAGYYGAETRAARVKAQQGINQMNTAPYALSMALHPGGPTPQPSYQPSQGIEGLGAVIAPMPGLGGQGGDSGYTGPSGQPMPPPAAVAPPPPPPGGYDTPSGQAPMPPQTVPIGNVAQVLAPGSHPIPQGVGIHGTPPPASPPSPGAPAAPNYTTSDGQQPNQDQGSGNFHPGSITDANGGRKQSGPASANGSPAQPGIDLAAYSAYLMQAGYDAASVTNALKSYVSQAYLGGHIDKNTAAMLDAQVGSGTIYSQDAETRRKSMDVGEKAREFNLTPQTGVDPATGRATFVMPGDVRTGMPRFEPNVYNTDVQAGQATVEVGGGGPYGSGLQIIRRKDLGAGQPGYNAQVDTANNAMIEVYADKKNPDPRNVIPMRMGDAIARGERVTPESREKAFGAVAGAATGAGGGNLSDVLTSMQPRTPLDQQEASRQRGERGKLVERSYAPTEKNIGRKEPGLLTTEAETALSDRTTRLQLSGDPQYRNNPDLAGQVALQQLQNEGVIASGDDVRNAREYLTKPGGKWIGNPDIQDQVVRGQVQGKFMVPLLKPYKLSDGTVIGGAKASDVITPKPGQVTPPAAVPPAATPPAAPVARGSPIGRAPPGTPDGTHTRADGSVVTVQNGMVYRGGQ
jgi:hypothetical protein